MSEKSFAKQTYALGKIYAVLASVIPNQDTPERRSKAPLHPMAAATEMLSMASAQRVLTDEIHDEITALYSEVDIDYPNTTPLEEQNYWWMGYYHRRDSVSKPVVRNQFVKDIRANKGLSQADVAEAIGVSQAAYNKWEAGKMRLSPENLSRLADVLGVEVDELI